MTSEQSRYCLRKRRASRRFRGDDSSLEELDSELLDKIRPCYLTPWIVKLLLDYDESEGSPEAQYGQVLKVLNEASPHGQDGQDPAAVVYIADGRHYIHTVVPIGAIQTAKDFPPQSGFSSILGQFIILQNFRVCVKKAAKAEDSGFYFRLDCFHVTTMKRCATRQQDCNRQPSVLQKIKELWLRGLALQPLPSPEPSPVSDILGEIKQDKLCTLKRSVEECFGLLDTSNLLNSEQLAVYPDTKWQTERKQDKVQCQDIFTVPAKFLLIGAEDEAALSRSRPPKPAHVASDSESSSDEDHSTLSFVSEAETVDGSLENPWDIFPGMTLTSSKEMSDTQPSLPSAQQMLLASTAEVEEAAGSSSYTPDDLQTRDPSSAQVEPAEVASPSLLPPDKEGISQKSRSEALNSTRNTSVIPDTDESIPSGRPLNNSPSHASMYGLSPILPSIRSTFLSKSGDVEENHPVHLQRETAVRGMGEKSQVTCRKCGAAKRKQLMPDEESVETPSRPLRISCKDRGLTSGVVFSKSSCLDSNQRAEKQPLKFVSESTPKKSRIDDTHVQPLQASAQSRCAKMHPGKLKEHSTATGRLDDSLGGHLEAQQQEHVRRAVSHHVYQPATAELCSQVHSTRISETLLGWARWVCRNKQKP
ncbi:adrenocortical dysplasia protein homolog isoform X2 [Paroedura picta]|uniref:adrenocortical dysplasia protein homolog isoform X2 n=1 Tax=Paroedura picta TaxID=143630 RepID=UPI0040575CBC